MPQLPLQNPLPQRSWLQSYGDASQMGHLLENERIANALKQNELNFAPKRSQAEIGEMDARAFEQRGRGTNYFEEAKVHPSQIRLNDAYASEAPYRNALTAAQTKYLPEKYTNERIRQQYLERRFNDSSQLLQFVKSLPDAARSQWINDNKEQYDWLMQNQGNLAINYSKNRLNEAGVVPVNQEQPQGNNALSQPIGEENIPKNSLNTVGASNIPPSNVITQPQSQTVAKQEVEKATSTPQFKALPPEEQEKQKLTFQRIANNKQVSQPGRFRAESATTMEKFLYDNQEKYVPRIENAVKYAGVIGKGKKAIDAMKAESPKAYLDYKWFKSDFTTTMANSVKQMEKLTGDQKQREELRDFFDKAVETMDVDPKGAVKLINMTINTMQDIASATINDAEPSYKGVYLKQAGIPEGFSKSEYIPTTVSVRRPDGTEGTIPADNLDKALKAGYTQVQ